MQVFWREDEGPSPVEDQPYPETVEDVEEARHEEVMAVIHGGTSIEV